MLSAPSINNHPAFDKVAAYGLAVLVHIAFALLIMVSLDWRPAPPEVLTFDRIYIAPDNFCMAR